MNEHKISYAAYIANRIRQKKLEKNQPEEVIEPTFMDEELPVEEEIVDPKAARKERIKAILAR